MVFNLFFKFIYYKKNYNIYICKLIYKLGKHSIAFSSGIAAITCVLHLLKPGDHVICSDDVYGGT